MSGADSPSGVASAAPPTPTDVLVRYLEKKVLGFARQLDELRPQLLREHQLRMGLQSQLARLQVHVQPQMQQALQHQQLQQQHQQLQQVVLSQAAGQQQQLQQQRQQHQQSQEQLQRELDAAKAELVTERRERRLADMRLDAANRVLRATRAAAHWTRVLEELDGFEHPPPNSHRRSRSPRR
jgi:hypothetical protein